MYVCAHVWSWVCNGGNRKRATDSLELTAGVCELHDVDAGGQSRECPSSLRHLSSPSMNDSSTVSTVVYLHGHPALGLTCQGRKPLELWAKAKLSSLKLTALGVSYTERKLTDIQIRCFCADRCTYITYKATATSLTMPGESWIPEKRDGLD